MRKVLVLTYALVLKFQVGCISSLGKAKMLQTLKALMSTRQLFRIARGVIATVCHRLRS